MSKGNVFSYELDEKQRFADPVKVRRTLLEVTSGRLWGIVQEINRTNNVIDDANKHIERLTADLSANPPTEDEIKFDQTKRTTTPFDQLPRTVQLEAYTGQLAITTQRVAQHEGVLAEAAVTAFDLPPFDPETGEGTTEIEALLILRAYLEYAEGKGWRLGS